MTRETKIGLLVGLAFIIVIGILLSDHLTSSNDPPPAVLANSAKSVRDTVVTPGGSQPQVQPVTVAPQITPNQQVRTQADLEAEQKAESVIHIGVGGPSDRNSAGAQSPTAIRTATPEAPAVAYIPSQPQQQPVTPPSGPAISSVSPGNTNHPLSNTAAQHGEVLVSVTPSGTDRPALPIVRNDGAPSGVLEYTVQSGDNLTNIARRVMGSGSKANVDAIVRANPSLQGNPDKIIVGKTYRIPSAASVATAAAPRTAPTTPVTTPPVATPAAAQNNGEFWYTIKEGDTLTRIVREQLGQGDAAVPALVELNRDIIRDPNSIPVNARIRLPGRPVAQIN